MTHKNSPRPLASLLEVLPAEHKPRWRRDVVTFLRRQYEPLETLSEESGLPIDAVIRRLVDEALQRRHSAEEPALVREEGT